MRLFISNSNPFAIKHQLTPAYDAAQFRRLEYKMGILKSIQEMKRKTIPLGTAFALELGQS